MSENEILDKLKSIIGEQLGVNKEVIRMESTFIDDLSADSLDIVELIMNLEEEFGIEIPDSESEKITSIEDVVKYIKENRK